PWPDIESCHAKVVYDITGQVQLLVPFVDIPEANVIYQALLTQSSDDTFTLVHLKEVRLNRLEPLTGAYFGANIDWTNASVQGTNDSFGLNLNAFVRFETFPISDEDGQWLDQSIEQIKNTGTGAMMILTLEPHAGLSVVTAEEAEKLAQRLKGYNDMGVPVLVRFAHEMNGSWYSWSQQPLEYIRAFRAIAEAIHRVTTNSAMLWAPNNGGGYPFTGGVYEAKPTASDFHLLDTNGNGVLDKADDSYAPYYPGDDAVDWVGMSLYHWGSAYPWGENEIPEHGKFIAQLTGRYVGYSGDESIVPDFYGIYAEGKNKPLAIPETAALFVPDGQGADEEQLIKQLWWRQVFDPTYRELYPKIKLISWFDWSKTESEIGNRLVNWRIGHDGYLTYMFTEDLFRSGVGIFIRK
ncbi:beta-mannanase, partial [Beggiatoa alba B18LD]